MEKLTKDRLKNSTYYCASGFDLQPLLRIGDITTDFIYVSIDINKEKYINSIKSYVYNLNIKENYTILKINSICDFNLTDIEHPNQGQLINRIPEWMSDNDFENYLANFNELRKNSEHFNLHINFTLTIGTIEKSLNLFYITGEALATYEAIFVNQDIAPKFFISIQSGLIEIPTRFTNNMFESHSNRPKVWIRGVWSNSSFDNESFRPDVFNISGFYNKKIGEFRNWDSQMGINIKGTTDDSKKYRVVRAYGEEKLWNFSDEDKSIVYESKNKNLKIRKLLENWTENLTENYSDGLADFDLTNFNNPKNENTILLSIDYIYEEYKFIAEQHPKIKAYKKAIMQMGHYESTEMYLTMFIESFKVINNVKLYIDIYYKSELDFKRDFK
jgi:hypothetical protein